MKNYKATQKELSLFDPSNPQKYLTNLKELFCENEHHSSLDKIKSFYSSIGKEIHFTLGDVVPSSDWAHPIHLFSDDVKRTYNRIGTKLDLDKIDLNKWWTACYKVFPITTVIHSLDCNSIDDVKRQQRVGRQPKIVLPKIKEILENKSSIRILEIGPGYGHMYDLITEEFEDKVEYWGLDVTKQFNCKTLVIGNGKKIPTSKLPKSFDFIFSYNVFQHLSRKQKRIYFDQISKLLVPNGEFWFSTFLVPSRIRGSNSWCTRKCLFFGQVVPIPFEDELYDDQFDGRAHRIRDCERDGHGIRGD